MRLGLSGVTQFSSVLSKFVGLHLAGHLRPRGAVRLRVQGARKVCALSLGILPMCAVAYPHVVHAEASLAEATWWEAPKAKGTCGDSFPTDRPIKPLELTETLTRKPWPEEYEINFVTYYAAQLARTIAGIEGDKFKNFLLKAAEDRVYTRPDMTSTLQSPVYIQSTIILLTAHYITYMQKNGNLTADERDILVNWVTPMLKWQKQNKKNASADSLSASGSALISWGSVIGDKRLVSQGLQRYKKGLNFALKNIGDLRRHPEHAPLSLDVLSLYDEYNNNIGHVVQGAAVLHNLGVDVYKIKIDGRNLHDAVAWWASVVWSRRDDPTNIPSGFTGYSRRGLNDNLGWIPIYVSMYPDAPEADLLRKMAREVAKGRRPMFEATAIGGATDCLWGFGN